MKILVDADACPKTVLTICQQIAKRAGVPICTVASFNHHIVSDHHVVVGSDPQEADMKIINLTEPGDIIITQDWGLAALALGKKALSLSPSGREYCPEKIEFLLEERETKAKIRRSGGRTKGPRKRNSEDDEKFSLQLERMLNRVLND
jgi:uncharacterized protein YaiI (UPF0178 family)